jgi:hypothetical protein
MADFRENTSDYIDVRLLKSRLRFEDEHRSACASATIFLLFSFLYILILDSHFQSGDSFKIAEGLRQFLNSIDADENSLSAADGMSLDGVHPPVMYPRLRGR